MSTDSIHLPSKNLTDRLRSCRRVLGTLERFGGNLTSKLATGFAPWMTGEPGKPFEAILAGLAGRLTAARDRLVDRDRAYRLQVTDAGLLRGVRDRATSALRSAHPRVALPAGGSRRRGRRDPAFETASGSNLGAAG